MKNAFLLLLVFLGMSMFAKAQRDGTYQPDTIIIFLDTVEQPLYTYGGVHNLVLQYDANGLLTHSRKESISNSLWHYKEDTYLYDDQHNYLTINTRIDGYDFYDVIDTRTQYTYQDGLMKSYCFYVYNMHGRNPWHCHDSIAYEYDNAGRLIKESTYYLSNHLTDVIYEYNGNVTVIVSQGFANGTSGTWQTLSQTTQNFSEQGVIINEITESFNQPTILKSYDYTDNGKVESILTQVKTDGQWQNSQWLHYSYDRDSHLTHAEIKAWKNNTFIDLYRAVYALDNLGYPIEVSFEKFLDGVWVEGSWQNGFYVYPDHHLKRQNDILCQENTQRILIHYCNTQLPDYDIDELPSFEPICTIHPNPTTGQITITGKDLKLAEVFNALGQRVASAKGEGERMTIDISTLPAGVYMVNVTDKDGRKCVKKVVKE